MLFLRQAEPNIRRYLPPFIFSDKTADAIARANNCEHEALRLAVADVANQFYVKTATWGLVNWERVLDIPTVVSDGYEARRKRILLKLQGAQTSTIKFMNTLINRYTTDGKGYIAERNTDYAFDIVVDVDTVKDWQGISKALHLYKPAHLGMYFMMKIMQEIKAQQYAECMQSIEARHCAWRLGGARAARWDGEFDLDGAIRMEGIVPGEGYKERQSHRAEIWFTVDAIQHNYALTNILDGTFCWDGGHNLSGAYMERLPILRAGMNMTYDTRQYNFVRQGSGVHICIDSKQQAAARFHGEIFADVESRQKKETGQQVSVTGKADAKQAEKAVMQAQAGAGVDTKQKIKLAGISASGQTIESRHTKDHRTWNVLDGGFCLNGSHALDGARLLDGRINHCCTVETNGRMESI